MTLGVRAWLGAGLAALLGAAALHALALVGAGAAWAAMVHLTLLGWITALIVAVRHHTLPVFTGRDMPAPQLAWLHLALFAGGVPLAAAGVSGLAGGAVRGLTAAGLALELAGGLVFLASTVLIHTRGAIRAGCPIAPPIPGLPATDRTSGVAVAVATASLPLALTLMLAAQLGLPGGEWWLAGEHLAALGWAMLMVVGVATRVLPRFTGRALRGVAVTRAQLACHLAALALMVPALALGLPQLFAAGGALMALATALFVWNVWPTVHHGRSRTTRSTMVAEAAIRRVER